LSVFETVLHIGTTFQSLGFKVQASTSRHGAWVVADTDGRFPESRLRRDVTPTH